MSATHYLFEQMGKFALETFRNSNAADHLRKLSIEAKEAEHNPDDIVEYADCLLCLFAALYRQGFDYDNPK